MPRCELCCRQVPEALALIYGVVCRTCLAEHLQSPNITMDDIAGLLTAEIVTD